MASLSDTIIVGNLNVTGNVYGNSFYATSDQNLKTNITDSSFPFNKVVNSIKLRDYNWKGEINSCAINVGVMAQEFENVIPIKYQKQFFSVRDDGYLTINESKMVYITIGALQELYNHIAALETRINLLEQKINEVK